MALKLTVLTPERTVMKSIEVDSVSLFTAEGQIQILPDHTSMVGILETGAFSYLKAQGGGDSGAISTGFFEVHQNVVTLTAETLELKSEIQLDRARAAQKKAQEELQNPGIDEHRFKKYQLKLQRSLVRQQIVSSNH